MSEVLDIVNEKNELTGKKEKRDMVHKKGLYHRASHVWIVNNKKEILCQKRSKNKKIFPAKWDMSFGGHVKSGDTYESTAISELKEELGIGVNPGDLIFIMDTKINQVEDIEEVVNREFVKIYVFFTNYSIDDFKIQKEEISEIKKIPIESARNFLRNNLKEFIPVKENYLTVLKKIENLTEK